MRHARSVDLHVALWILSALFFGCFSLAVGMNVTWDTRNYHFYNAYSLLHGRMNLDWAPGQRQTFLNPALDILPYLAMRHWPAQLTGFLLGAVHGLNFALAAELGLALWKRVAPDLGTAKRWALSLLAAAIGCYTTGFAVVLGSLSHDNETSLFGLAAIWLVCIADESRKPPGTILRLALAGVLMGLGVGLKLNAAAFAVALAVALPLLATSVKSALRNATLWSAFAAFGLLLSLGWWMVILYNQFGSPLFPLYNNIFRSDWLPPITYIDTRWPAKTLGEVISFPFRMVSLGATGCEQEYRDGHYMIWVFGLLGAPFFLRNLRGSVLSEGRPRVLMLIVFSVVALALSMKLHGCMRYMVLLELLVPILVLLLAGIRPTDRRWALPLFIALFVANALWLRTPQAERIPWQDRYFSAAVPPIPAKDTLIVMMAEGPDAYVIPFFNPAIRFVRPQGNLVFRENSEPPSRYEEAVWKQVREHRGALYVMIRDTPLATEQFMGKWRVPEWKPRDGEPVILRTNIETYRLVAMTRTAPTS